MPENIVDILARTPEVLRRYEELHAAAQRFVGQHCPASFTAQVHEFSVTLNQMFGQTVTGRHLALARLRSAAATKREAFVICNAGEERVSGGISL